MSNILMTGCSTGIGFATAVLLARNNHSVFATMRDPSQNTDLQNLVEKEHLSVTILQLDVTKEESVTTAVNAMLGKAGKIDVLINNAGIGLLGAVEELPMENFVDEMNTNYLGTVRCTKAVLSHMRENKKGCIINISSVGGRLYNYFNASYSASKAAMEAFSECLAMEILPFGIRVAVVEPGVVDTPMQQKCKPKIKETHYANLERAVAFFAAATDHHVPPEVVAEVVSNIVNGSSTKFRNPAGPDSQPFLEFRSSVSDEDWIASAGMDEQSWIRSMEGMNLNVKPFMLNS